METLTNKDEYPVILTERAIQAVKEVLAEDKDLEGLFLKISVIGNGCAGFQFSLTFDKEVKESVEKRMMAERQRIAKKYISEGEGEAQRIMGDKEREVKTVLSEAYKTSKGIEGKADAQATEIYAKAFSKDPQFYQFVRTLQLYEEGIGKDTKLILGTDNSLFRLIKGEYGLTQKESNR